MGLGHLTRTKTSLMGACLIHMTFFLCTKKYSLHFIFAPLTNIQWANFKLGKYFIFGVFEQKQNMFG